MDLIRYLCGISCFTLVKHGEVLRRSLKVQIAQGAFPFAGPHLQTPFPLSALLASVLQ